MMPALIYYPHEEQNFHLLLGPARQSQLQLTHTTGVKTTNDICVYIFNNSFPHVELIEALDLIARIILREDPDPFCLHPQIRVF